MGDVHATWADTKLKELIGFIPQAIIEMDWKVYQLV